MGLRFNCKAAAVAQAGTAFTHNLVFNGASTAPDEWKFNLRGPNPGAAALYLTGAPTSISLTIAASGAAGTADVFAHINHTIYL